MASQGSVILKEDQPTGRQVHGIVEDVLTQHDHPRGVKVLLMDGRVGRVQEVLNSGYTSATPFYSTPPSQILRIGRLIRAIQANTHPHTRSIVLFQIHRTGKPIPVSRADTCQHTQRSSKHRTRTLALPPRGHSTIPPMSLRKNEVNKWNTYNLTKTQNP